MSAGKLICRLMTLVLKIFP